jgi:hypothetical protein
MNQCITISYGRPQFWIPGVAGFYTRQEVFYLNVDRLRKLVQVVEAIDPRFGNVESGNPVFCFKFRAGYIFGECLETGEDRLFLISWFIPSFFMTSKR